MSVNSLFPFTTGVTRGLQSALWDNVPFEPAQSNPEYGSFFYSDINNYFDVESSVTALNSGASESFTKIAGSKGKRRLTATTDTDHKGVQVLLPDIGSFQPAAGRQIVVDFGVNLRLCSTFFIGLVEDGITILSASSALPTNKDFIGFYRLNGGAVQFLNHKEDSPDVDDSISALLAATYYHKESTAQDEVTRLGFKIDRLNRVYIAVDNVGYESDANTLSSSSIPDAALTPGIAIARGADQDEASVVLDVDYIAAFSS